MVYFGLFISAFVAATVVPMSSEAAMWLAVEQGYALHWILISVSIGNFLGGASCYYLGLWCKWNWLNRYFSVKQGKMMKHASALCQRYGAYAALLCWLPIIGEPIAVALGAVRVNAWAALTMMFIGKTARYILLLYLIT